MYHLPVPSSLRIKKPHSSRTGTSSSAMPLKMQLHVSSGKPWRGEPVVGLDGVLPRPLPRRCLVPRPVRLVHVGDFRNERIVRVWVCEHGADREKDCEQC